MEAEEENRKRKLDLDWNKLLSRQAGDEEQPPPFVVIKSEPQPPPRKSNAMGGGDDQSKDEFFENLSDHNLEETIRGKQRTLEKFGFKLKDKGQKMKDLLERLEEEKKRRTLSRAKMGCSFTNLVTQKNCSRRKLDANGCEKPAQLPSSDIVGSFGQQSKSHQAFSQSTFGAGFCKKMEDNTDCRIVNTFDKDISILNHCGRQKTRCNGELSQREMQKVRVSPRRMNSQHHRQPYIGDQKVRTASVYSLRDRDTDDDLPSIAKKNAFQVRSSNGLRCRKGQTVVLVDEEEPQLVKTTEPEVEFPNCKKDDKIYYPSRDDPESVEICFGDIDSLAPETFLTSQIMNFYIRFLQQQASPTNRAICDYHFFNTYFYQKLKEAVSYKGSDKDALFVKFRRWWKGVNIFQKAYVLIPINEE
ncbi:hypothetical protein REPUB_Repub04eG0175900 [Reevesia pubescens]